MKYILIITILLFIIVAFCFAQEQELKQTTNWLKDIWYKYILPWLQNIWQQICSFLGKEVEKRKPKVEQEFKKETQELKQEIQEQAPKTFKSLWQRLKEVIY